MERMFKRIKVLYTIPNFKTAGSQYVLLSLFRNIDKTVFDAYICIEKYPETVPSDILEDSFFIFKWTGNKTKDLLNFRKTLKEFGIDIVHSWDYKSSYLEALACRMAGVRYLYTKKNNAWSKRWQLKSFLSHHIAYDNPVMRTRFFDSFLFRNKISFIPHGIDTSIFKPLEQTPHNTFNIVCIGNIGANKNQLFIIKALKDLPAEIHLHLYGNEDKAYREKINNYISSNSLSERVHFKGFIVNTNIPNVFRNADLFVLASLQEGLPVSILEALACGVPALSSDSGGGARHLLGEENMFNLEDSAELIQKILRVYSMKEMERINMIKEGVQNIIENHTLEKEVNTYENLYRTLITSIH